jgi:uncharacterized DUF497 family protein
LRCIWDPEKNRSNERKHGIGFETAMRAFADPFAFSRLDRIEGGEERWQTIGLIDVVAVVLVAHTFHEDDHGEETIRIISARRATKRERQRYEQERTRQAGD